MAASDPASVPLMRGLEIDLAIHFVTNWVIWAIIGGLITRLWWRRKTWGLAALGVVAAGLVIVFLLVNGGLNVSESMFPLEDVAPSSALSADRKPLEDSTPIDHTEVAVGANPMANSPTVDIAPTSTPVPEPTPTAGPVFVFDDFSEDTGIWLECGACRWTDGGLIIGPSQDYVTGDTIYALCGPCGRASNYRMAVEASFYDGMAGGGYGFVLSSGEDFLVFFRISTFQMAGLDQIENGVATVLVGQHTTLIRPGRSSNHLEVIVTDAPQSGRSDIRLNINGKTLTVYSGIGISPTMVGLAVASEQGVLFDNFEFEELEP